MNPPAFCFTVFTPTYNRGDVLHRVFDSLRKQTFRDFEWLVIDDGSTDDTRTRVEAWAAQADFPVRYIWQKNAHKKAAFNHGVREARGELFLPLDSDDEIFDTTLEVLNDTWTGIPEAQRAGYSAVTGLCVHSDGKVVGDAYPHEPLDSNTVESKYRYRIRGEKFGFQRTDVLRKFPFPEDVKGLVPESTVWYAIARSGLKTRYINKPLRIYHQTADSLMQEKSAAIKHAGGHALVARDTLENIRWFRYHPMEFILAAARYTRFHLHMARTPERRILPVSKLAGRLLILVMAPVGLAWFLYDLSRSAR